MITQEVFDELMTRINDVRHLMISTGINKGLNDYETLKYSEELDKLINKYQLLTSPSPHRS
ncbi:aspartyl-phosphate phosphatase Spo0E family protein [Bacillus aerolatus]|nr:aspartyl-phosphate phosphatase Spo0E family protein [Bacillus aerolatus]